jgi:Bacterial Ig-like domain (group 2)
MKKPKFSKAVATGLVLIAAILYGCGSNNPSLMMITVTPNPAVISLATGSTQQFTAIGTYSDDSTYDITSTATWSTSDATVATISNTTGSQGLATAVTSTAGMTNTISATDPTTGIMGATTLTVEN